MTKNKKMKIDETLKSNLITDVEHTIGIDLKSDQIESLKRAFEITVGHAISSLKSMRDVKVEKGDVIDKFIKKHAITKQTLIDVYLEFLKQAIESVQSTESSPQSQPGRGAELKETLIKFCNLIGYDYKDNDNLDEFMEIIKRYPDKTKII